VNEEELEQDLKEETEEDEDDVNEEAKEDNDDFLSERVIGGGFESKKSLSVPCLCFLIP
jgi:hypothetical protein